MKLKWINMNNMDEFEEICKLIIEGERIAPELVYNKTRKREVCFTRQVCMYFGKQKTKRSLASIGLVFGKDHATVLHACKTVNNLIDTDPKIRLQIAEYDQQIDDLKKEMYGTPALALMFRVESVKIEIKNDEPPDPKIPVLIKLDPIARAFIKDNLGLMDEIVAQIAILAESFKVPEESHAVPLL